MQRNTTSAIQQMPIVVPPGGGDPLRIGEGQFIQKVRSGDTGGVFSVVEVVTPPRGSVALHVHEREDELVYVLDGTIEVTLGDQTMTATAGVLALLPRGIPHGFTNVGTTPSRVLDTILPGAFDGYFVEAAALYSNGEPDAGKVDALSRKYAIRYL
ncbi:MAG TPA: cupin domain-containing protein [Vicinamibacterales bacterium]|nr:cupin domain-containing protein [Vicinamibacterales bacterium]